MFKHTIIALSLTALSFTALADENLTSAILALKEDLGKVSAELVESEYEVGEIESSLNAIIDQLSSENMDLQLKYDDSLIRIDQLNTRLENNEFNIGQLFSTNEQLLENSRSIQFAFDLLSSNNDELFEQLKEALAEIDRLQAK